MTISSKKITALLSSIALIFSYHYHNGKYFLMKSLREFVFYNPILRQIKLFLNEEFYYFSDKARLKTLLDI